MDFEKFKEYLHESWWDRLKPFIESEECDGIYEFLKHETGRGRKIAPLSSNVWRAFKETPFDELKGIILGFSPYHTFTKDGKPIADGILMSCSVTGYLQPSLENFYMAMEKELGIKSDRNPSLSYLCHQGLLMLNLSLTVEKNKPGSHISIWEPFMKYLFEEVIITTGMPVVLLGKESLRVKKYLFPFTWIIELSNPASAACIGGEWDSEGMFTKINTILKENNNFEIKWNNTNI